MPPAATDTGLAGVVIGQALLLHASSGHARRPGAELPAEAACGPAGRPTPIVGLRLVDLDRASDTVSLLLRHVRGRVRRACARPVRGVNRLFEGVAERRCLALLDAFEDDLVRLHDVVDVESQVPDSGMADQLLAQPRGEVSDQRRLGQPDS